MTKLAEDFIRLGFIEEETEEEQITIYSMDFPSEDAYIIVTDDSGKTPISPEEALVIACYNNEDCFIWGKQLENSFALEKLLMEFSKETPELFSALVNYTLPKK